MKVIEFKNVSKTYNSHLAVKDFSLEIEQGERVAILGHSGCGKTTILRLLAGFIAPESGSISIGGEVVASDGKIVKDPEKRNVGMVFQDLALWPHLSVKGNLEFGLKAKKISIEERAKRIKDILKRIQMEKYVNALPSELSGGQQQRVALARALTLFPEVLLMDEPLSNLDLELNIQLRNEIIKLHQELCFSLIYVTHDREEAYEIAKRIVVMQNGQIRFIG
jgi:ABC-type Fe3+/spermidine/putrescine transport system ATPase subunit